MFCNIGDEDESFCNRYLDPNWSFREYYNIEDVHLAFRSVHLVVPKHQDARTHLQYREMVDQIFHKVSCECIRCTYA